MSMSGVTFTTFNEEESFELVPDEQGKLKKRAQKKAKPGAAAAPNAVVEETFVSAGAGWNIVKHGGNSYQLYWDGKELIRRGIKLDGDGKPAWDYQRYNFQAKGWKDIDAADHVNIARAMRVAVAQDQPLTPAAANWQIEAILAHPVYKELLEIYPAPALKQKLEKFYQQPSHLNEGHLYNLFAGEARGAIFLYVDGLVTDIKDEQKAAEILRIIAKPKKIAWVTEDGVRKQKLIIEKADQKAIDAVKQDYPDAIPAIDALLEIRHNLVDDQLWKDSYGNSYGNKPKIQTFVEGIGGEYNEEYIAAQVKELTVDLLHLRANKLVPQQAVRIEPSAPVVINTGPAPSVAQAPQAVNQASAPAPVAVQAVAAPQAEPTNDDLEEQNAQGPASEQAQAAAPEQPVHRQASEIPAYDFEDGVVEEEEEVAASATPDRERRAARQNPVVEFVVQFAPQVFTHPRAGTFYLFAVVVQYSISDEHAFQRAVENSLQDQNQEQDDLAEAIAQIERTYQAETAARAKTDAQQAESLHVSCNAFLECYAVAVFVTPGKQRNEERALAAETGQTPRSPIATTPFEHSGSRRLEDEFNNDYNSPAPR